MSLERHLHLMIAAQKRFRDGGTPFEYDFLSNHHVTGDECIDMSNAVATAIGLYVLVRREMQQSGLVGSVAMRRMADAILAEVTQG